MWITTLTIDLAAVRNLSDEEKRTVLLPIRLKKNELRQDPTVAGSSVPPFILPDNFDDIPPDQATAVSKRQWASEAAALEFASFANAAVGYVTATVEEQV